MEDQYLNHDRDLGGTSAVFLNRPLGRPDCIYILCPCKYYQK